jgi:hypothetical protein
MPVYLRLLQSILGVDLCRLEDIQDSGSRINYTASHTARVPSSQQYHGLLCYFTARSGYPALSMISLWCCRWHAVVSRPATPSIPKTD